MLKKLRMKKKEQGGFVVGTELIFLLSCVLCVAVIAWGSFGAKVVGEWADLGGAIGSLNQSFTLTGMQVFHPNHHANEPVATFAGSSYTDFQDFCDQRCNCGVVICVPFVGELSKDCA